MSVYNADGVMHVTRAEWDALREQHKWVLADNAEIRGAARQSRSEAVEQRLCCEDNRLERDKAAVAQLTEAERPGM